ncbi:MAG: methylated-DNA--[protein]-cysteine S-methyltransferase [Sulfurimonas sp.]|nr:methylated-DNA--[protein]-cysteine S-methyltransferase [Sulfurimonas sp.]MDD3835166.1 methylated-DNA--[protein]-cysteine S-methyltransferase [Sulfurimonas sp.]
MQNQLYNRVITTPLGNMIATADEDAIISFDFIEEGKIYQSINAPSPLLLRLEKEVLEYFRGERKEFTIPLSPSGTTFQKEVWKTLLSIPYGTTVSYKTEAKIFGNPKAIRAVANANGKNPISILIPCHRVIASDGSLGGYSGGLDKKEFLLSLESDFIQ